MNELNKKIIELSKSLGFELIGFCKLDYFKELENILIKQENLKYKTSFQIGKIEDKVFKDTNYKSAIVVGLTYNKINVNLKRGEVYFSSCAWGDDYHIVIKEKLKFIENFLKNLGYSSYISVDNSIYDERYLAYKAGLGFYGKNGLLINKKYGSFFFIGIVLTDAIMDYNEEDKSNCLNCNLCVNACPTKAINNNKIINGNKCLSYLTQKKNIEDDEKKYINSCVYGCDICSNVCPYNKNITKSNNFTPKGIELFEEEKFLNMDEKEYQSLYKKNSSYWRGKKIIDRNIKINRENNLKK